MSLHKSTFHRRIQTQYFVFQNKEAIQYKNETMSVGSDGTLNERLVEVLQNIDFLII